MAAASSSSSSSSTSNTSTLRLVDLYVLVYNAACCAGWTVIWLIAMKSLFDHVIAVPAAASSGGDDIYFHAATPRMVLVRLQEALANVYSITFLDKQQQRVRVIETLLIYTQTAAVLEIVHALLRLVRSPVFATTLQVSSRLVALWTIVCAPSAQHQLGAGLMIVSWASVEVPRYLFYMVGIVTGNNAVKQSPFWLFWLRYSLFAVLYPTGIYGEYTVFKKAAYDPHMLERFGPWITPFYGHVLIYIYVVGAPFMIWNMARNRMRAFAKRYAKPPPPLRGLVWPVDARGDRSSTHVNKQIWAAAVHAMNNPTMAEAILRNKNWRFEYVKYIQALVKEQCASPSAALAAAQAGLDKAYELFEFVHADGSVASFAQVMQPQSQPQTSNKNNIDRRTFCTGSIQGKGKMIQNQPFQVPYKGQVLSGNALKQQIQAWVTYGTIEPSCGTALCQVVDHPEWLSNITKKRCFVLLGAGSAMGPLEVLLALGAHVIAIDLNRPHIWQRLITLARNSPGYLTFPMNCMQHLCGNNDHELFAAAGCNLFTDTPAIRDWLQTLYPTQAFTVGSYAYLDGALHVQVSLAMDAIVRDLCAFRPNTSVAYLCTPTDVHLIPQDAYDAARVRYAQYNQRWFCKAVRILSSGSKLRKNAQSPIASPNNGETTYYYYVNGISVAQGPNYALAKRLQHWRAIVAHSQGCIVSSNIAPSTSTVSVVHNRSFAWAYQGMPYFQPIEIFAPATSNAVMAALLVYDLNDPTSSGNPKNNNTTLTLTNPNQLFSFGAFHGGLWRCAYEVNSIGEASVLLYFGRLMRPILMLSVPILVSAAAVAWTH